MSRYTGPRIRKMRALGVDLPGLSAKSIERRPYPPGVHGQQRRKVSDYGIQLAEKQKLVANYGVSERQLRNVVKTAQALRGNTGGHLVALLERRLDNVVFRAGFAPTIPAARQLVNHGHFMVNGRRVDIASFRVSPGDVVEVRARSTQLAILRDALQTGGPYRPEWLDVSEAHRRIKMVDLPNINSAPFPLETQLIIEFYSRSS